MTSLRAVRGLHAVGCAALLAMVAMASCAYSLPSQVAVGPQYRSAPAPSEEKATLEDEIARIAATFAASAEDRTLAVFELPHLEGKVSNLSRLVSEQVTTALVRKLPPGRVVERRQVLQVMEEVRFQAAQPTPDEIVSAARRLGADAIVLGTTVAVGDRVMLNARLVDVAGMQVLAADGASVKVAPELARLKHVAVSDLVPKAPHATRSARGGTTSVAQPVAEAEAYGFRFSALGCDISGSFLRCELLVENLEKRERTLQIFGGGVGCRKSAVYDDLGNKYCPIVTFGSGRSPWVVKERLLPGVPVKAALEVEGVESEFGELSLALVMSPCREGSGVGTVLLRKAGTLGAVEAPGLSARR